MSKRVKLDWKAMLDNMPTKPKFDIGDRVKVFRQTGEFLAKGTILGWTYDRSEKVYDYLVQSLDGERRAYFEEPQITVMNSIQLRDENKFRTPIYGRNFHGSTTFVGALYPEGNVQVYWTWKWFDFQRHESEIQGGSRYCGFQFQNIGHLIGMWNTREIITGLPYDFSHLITTHFAEFYKKHMTTFVLSEKEREALGISEEEYIRANKTVWGESYQLLTEN